MFQNVKLYNKDKKPISDTDPLPAKLTGSTALNHGTKTVTAAGTRVQLHADLACKSVMITALATNTNYIFVGGATVAAASYGKRLAAGDTLTLPVANLNLIYLDAAVSGEGVRYLVLS